MCVWKRGSFRSVLQSEGSKYSVWFGSGGWGSSIGWGWWNKFSVLSRKAKKHKKYTLIIPLSDWTIIYFASMLANSVISSILALRSSCTLNPCLQHPRLCVWSCTLVMSLSIYLMYPYLPGLLFLSFVVCCKLASLSIVTGVAVSCNEVKPDSGIQIQNVEWKQEILH